MINTRKPRFSLLLPKPVESMQREMEHLVDHFFPGASEARSWHAAASLWEEEGRWCVDVELPGVKQDDIEITLEKNTLRVAAEKRPGGEDRKYWHNERGYGRIERAITLPETADPEAIEAELRDGVLHLSLAKKAELQPKKIVVKTQA